MLLLPGIFVLTVVFAVPLLSLLTLAVRSSDGTGITLANFSHVFLDAAGREAIRNSLSISAGATLICLLLGFPIAYQAARSKGAVRDTIVLLTVFPLLTSSVVLTFGWTIALMRRGALDFLLSSLGIDSPPTFTGSALGVAIALAGMFLPFMVLTLYSVIREIPVSLEEAALDLGDRPLTVWLRVIVPLAWRGVVGGVLLVFSLSLSAYVTPKLVGQSRVLTLATMIFEQALVLVDYRRAAAFAVVLLGTTLLASLIASRLTKVGSKR